MDSTDALSRSRCRERRLNKALKHNNMQCRRDDETVAVSIANRFFCQQAVQPQQPRPSHTVTDGQTDKQTDTLPMAMSRSSIAQRDKNGLNLEHH